MNEHVPPRNRAERRAAARAAGRRAGGTALTATKVGALVATSAAAAFVGGGLPSAGAATTITVTSSADSGAGTLRDALANANNGDTIVFAPGVTSITLA